MREVKATVSILLEDSSTMSDEAVRDLLRQSLRDHIGNPTRVSKCEDDERSAYNIKEVELKYVGPSQRDGADWAILIGWTAEDIGLGELTICYETDKEGIKCDTECMSKAFVEAVMLKLVDTMELRDR